MSDERPDPEALLARVQEDEARRQRGRLKIFFGAAPGVGKTYTMLEAGHEAAREGVDVQIGYIEPHVRPETQALVIGLDVLPRKIVEYRDVKLSELDVDAVLQARPQLVLIDELAHTNAPSMTHPKRWQDVEQILAAGIDVYSTLNVQHLESLNDIVAQITGVQVRETVPDAIFEQADDVELVDLPPDDLIERMREGKIYLPQTVGRAIENFFKKGNLIALRELALRRTAERVNAQMQDYRHRHAVQRTWPTSDRLLVSIGPSPHASRLVRAARRMAASLRAPWLAVHVETTLSSRLSSTDADRLAQTMHLAEELGAETVTIAGTNLVDDLLAYARQRNVTKIVVGKPLHSRWSELLRGSFVYELTRKCGDIDIYVISGDDEARAVSRAHGPPVTARPLYYLGALLVVALCTGIGWLMTDRFALANIIMVYLLGVVAVSVQWGRGPSILASIAGVAAFDFFFVPPQLTFAVSDTQYLVTFAVMLVTGLVISTLTARVKDQAEAARQREARTAALYALSRQLVKVTSVADLSALATRQLGEAFHCRIHLFNVDSTLTGSRRLQIDPTQIVGLSEHDLAVAEWVLDHGERAGLGTDTLPSASALFLPLQSGKGIVGILALQPFDTSRAAIFTAEQMRLFETFGSQLALAQERIQAVADAQKANVQVESERLRNSLLSMVSHDLRTPLTAIAGASSTLLHSELDPETRRELAKSISEEAERLNRLVANLLDMTRLESGTLQVHKEWHVFAELLGVVLRRLQGQLIDKPHHPVATHVPSDLPLIPVDALLIQQVLTNLLENAVVHTPEGTPIDVSASTEDGKLIVEVADRGPGLIEGDEDRIFEKFHRSRIAAARGGAGLGLAICRGIIHLHGGSISARNRPGGGTIFRFTLPLADAPPVPKADQRQVASD